MERRLVLMRHAKSSWQTDAPNDHARPLNARGQRAAPLMARAIDAAGFRPEQILSSDSERTRQTARLLLEVWGDVPLQFLRGLYQGGVKDVCAAVSGLPPELEQVLVLGHNPGWEEAIEWLSGRAGTLKTADAALLVGAGESWREAVRFPGTMELRDILRSRDV